MCGLPGSGKTTLAKALGAYHQGTTFCADDWMDALGIDLWDSARRDATEALQWQQVRDLLALGGTAIIEWGTWARPERDMLREGARNLGAAVELIFLDAPPEVLFARISARGRETPAISLEQLREFSAAIEWPTAEELALYDPSPERSVP